MATNRKNSKKTTKSTTKKTSDDNSFLDIFAHDFWKTSIGNFVKILLGVLLLFLINLLISRNNYQTFYILLGIEILIGVIVIVARLIIQQKDANS